MVRLESHLRKFLFHSPRFFSYYPPIVYNRCMPKKGEVSTIAMSEDDLSPVQALFLSSYLRTWNARQSAVAADIDPELGRQMLKSLEVVLRDRLGDDYMTDEELEMRLIDIARGVGPEYLDRFGFVKFQKLIEDNKTHLIKSITRTKDGINVTFYDSQRALETIGKTRGVVHGDVKRHLVGHVVADEGEVDKLIDKIYNREPVEVIDGEFTDRDED